jgi:hypothetical protein
VLAARINGIPAAVLAAIAAFAVPALRPTGEASFAVH